MCRPSMVLPALDHTTQQSQKWFTPELGLNSTQVKEFLSRLMYLRQQEKCSHRCQLNLKAYSPSFPTCLSHPRKCAPSLLNSPSSSPFPFSGLRNRSTGSLRSLWLQFGTFRKEIPIKSLTQRELLMGLTTRLFSIPWA
jgi:hypothetical protein